MGEVVAFKPEPKKVRKTTLRSEARKLLAECLNGVPKPVGVVIVAVGEKGKMNLRFFSEPDLYPIDLLARAEAMAQAEKLDFLIPGYADDEEDTGE